MTEPPKHETDEDIIDRIEQQQHDAQEAADNEYSKYLAEDEIVALHGCGVRPR